jgi:hypothetical protein
MSRREGVGTPVNKWHVLLELGWRFNALQKGKEARHPSKGCHRHLCCVFELGESQKVGEMLSASFFAIGLVAFCFATPFNQTSSLKTMHF